MESRNMKNAVAYEELKTLFVHNEFERGTIVSINDIASRINMGRSPVTEALKRLETEKYIRIIPQKGVIVRDMTIQEMLDLNEVRIALEGFSIKKAAIRVSNVDIDFLYGLTAAQREALVARNVSKFRDLDEEFHIFLSKASGNSYIFEQVQYIRERVFNVALKLLKIPGRMETTLAEHNKIVDALSKGNANEASRCMVEHLEMGRRHITML